MRALYSCLLLIASVSVMATEKRGVAFPTLVYFSSAAGDELILYPRNHIVQPGNDCTDRDSCDVMYDLEFHDPFREVPILSVTTEAVGNSQDFKLLRMKLGEGISDVKSLVIVAHDLKAIPRGGSKKVGYFELAVKPQLMSIEVDDGEAFEGVRNPIMVQYQAILPDALKLDRNVTNRLSSALSISDPGDYDRTYRGYVGEVVQETPYVYTLRVHGAPRGKKVNVQVGGIESFGGTPLAATTAVQTVAVPKGREDASLYARLGAEANDVKGERKYSVDVRAREAWLLSSRWQFAPTLDVLVGNKTAGSPNTASLATEFRYFIPGSENFRTRLVLAPIFRTDRAFENENLGVDVALEMLIPRLDRSLEWRRKDEKRAGGPPLARVWGWSFRPVVAIETGRHIKSSSDEVDGETFSRFRGGLALMLERGRWKLTGSAVDRHLFSEEVLLNGAEAVVISDDPKRFFRADLAYDFGTAGLAVTYLNGRQPPAYSPTDSVSLGVTLKY